MTSDTAHSTSSQPAAESAACEPSRGRPRDEERTAAIIDATHSVMHEKGWYDLTMSEIAKEAGCGLATIYRRWSTKEALVADAMRARPLPEIEETGDARTDLRTLLVAMADEHAQMGDSVIGFLAATQSDPALYEAFSQSIMAIARPRIGELIGRILGADSPHIELLIDGMAGSLLIRAAVFHNFTTPEQWADEIMALIDAIDA